MYASSVGQLLRSIVGGLIASVLFVSVSVAALSPQQLQTAEQQFLANPSQFLATHKDFSRQDLAQLIAALAATPANLPTIMSALANADPSQQRAIGTGLGRAADAAKNSDPAYAAQIQQAVAASGLQDVIASYTSATSNTQTSSTGGSLGGGGSPTGNGPPTGGGGSNGGSTGGGGSFQTGNAGSNGLTGGGTVGSTGTTGSSGSVSP